MNAVIVRHPMRRLLKPLRGQILVVRRTNGDKKIEETAADESMPARTRTKGAEVHAVAIGWTNDAAIRAAASDGTNNTADTANAASTEASFMRHVRRLGLSEIRRTDESGGNRHSSERC